MKVSKDVHFCNINLASDAVFESIDLSESRKYKDSNKIAY
jgi:hypothetical protein